MLKIYLGISSPQSDPPNFFVIFENIFQKIAINSRDGPESSTCVCGPMFRVANTFKQDSYPISLFPSKFWGIKVIFNVLNAGCRLGGG